MNRKQTLTIVALSLMMAGAGAARGEREQLRNLAGVPLAQRNPISLEKVWPADVGGTHVCLWKDDKVGAFSVTIDDNTKPDHAWWLEQGRKYGFRFTWFVVTDGLLKGANPGFTGTWQDFQTLLDNGHDVQSHTVSHRSKSANLPLEDDYAPAIEQINTHLKGTRCLTMAYPGGGLTNDPAVAARFFAGSRGTRNFPNSPSPNYLETHSIGGVASALIEPGNKGDWASIIGVVEKHDKRRSVYRSWYCVHFHGVHANEATRQKLEPPALALLDYVKQHEDKFWVALFREVILYGQERDTATVTVKGVDDREIRFDVSDRMADDWYDFPLTVKVRVQNTWQQAEASQDKHAVPVSMIDHEGARYALVQAVPDRGEIVLRAGAARQEEQKSR